MPRSYKDWLRRLRVPLFQLLRTAVCTARQLPNLGTVLYPFQWLCAFFLCFFSYAKVTFSKASKAFHQVLCNHQVPWQYPRSWHFQPSVVYLRISFSQRQWYIGSTHETIKEREQSRHSKFTQIRRERQAYFEPALRFWLVTGTYDQFYPLVLKTCPDAGELRAHEALLIRQHRSRLNAPWVHQELKKLGFSVKPILHHNTTTGAPGRRLHRRRRGTARRLHLDLAAVDLQEASTHLQLLSQLGSNSVQKFTVSRFLRSQHVPLSFLYYLVRLTPMLDSLERARATTLLTSALRFRGGDIPPMNRMLKVLQGPGNFLQAARSWIKSFVEHNSLWFPPYHLPKVKMVEVQNRTLGQVLFNHRKFIKDWTHAKSPACACHHAKDLPRTKWGHIFCSATDAVTLYPNLFHSVLTHSMTDTVWASEQQFLRHHHREFTKFASAWKLPKSAVEQWDEFVSQHWTSFQRAEDESVQAIKAASHCIRHWVTLPVDHFPTQLHIACPVQFHLLLIGTFFDGTIFRPLPQSAAVTRDQILKQARKQLRNQKALILSKPLPKAYLLPKASKGWCGARPIVAYNAAWNGKISQVVAAIITQVVDRVFGRKEALPSVMHILQQMWKIMQAAPIDEELLLMQQDVAGFFNAVPHSRILDSLRVVLHQFMQREKVDVDHELSVSVKQADQFHRVFRGRYRKQAHRHFLIAIHEIPHMVSFLLQAAALSVGTHAVQQVQGASMGSQLAPVLCSMVAALKESQWQQIVKPLSSHIPYALHARYVDNRILLGFRHTFQEHVHHAFTRLDWFGPPLMLENVADIKILGFQCDPRTRTMTMVMPSTAGSIRHPRSACSLSILLSGFRSRAELVCRHTRPRQLIVQQLQVLEELYIRQGYAKDHLAPVLSRLRKRFRL